MRRRGDRGFTLVELLVALTLLALVSSMLLGALRFGARSWDSAAARTAERDATAAVQGFLRARLSEASTPGDGAAPLSLGGSEAALGFVAPWETASGRGGLHRFALFPEGGALVLAWALEGAPEEVPDAGGRRALLDGVAGLRIAYFGAPDPARPPLWLDAWAESDGAPALVRIEVAFADEGRLWPPLVVGRGP